MHCQAVIELDDDFQPTCMAHPDAYLNKVVVGSDDGRLQLWNFSSGQRLFEFRPAQAAVRCLAPSPALDVIGIGLAGECAFTKVLKRACRGSLGAVRCLVPRPCSRDRHRPGSACALIRVPAIVGMAAARCPVASPALNVMGISLPMGVP